MKDALGNPVILGKFYGYSQNSNGHTNIKIGKAVKFNEKSVTLEVIAAKSAIYSDDPTDEKITRKKVSPKANMLFPVDETQIN